MAPTQPLLQILNKRNRLFLLPPLLFLSLSATVSSAYSVPKPAPPVAAVPSSSSATTSTSGRRAFLSNLAIASSATFLTTLGNKPANANAATTAAEEQLKDVYFGAGCFWHVQHEFVEAERSLLQRKDGELTSRTGYAGGFKTDGEGRVCYHNFQSIADYGKLGHGEVVGMTIPESSVGDFAVEYFKLFGTKGERADPMDKGGEYRSLLGLPGGKNHPMYAQVEAAGKEQGMTLVDGKGNDPDTLGKRLVYVMDSNKFPFYQAEVYHQYHDDFLSPSYGKAYNSLGDAAVDDGRIKITGCPDRIPNVQQKMGDISIAGNKILPGIAFGLLIVVIIIAYRRKKPGYMSIDQNMDNRINEATESSSLQN